MPKLDIYKQGVVILNMLHKLGWARGWHLVSQIGQIIKMFILNLNKVQMTTAVSIIPAANFIPNKLDRNMVKIILIIISRTQIKEYSKPNKTSLKTSSLAANNNHTDLPHQNNPNSYHASKKK